MLGLRCGGFLVRVVYILITGSVGFGINFGGLSDCEVFFFSF